MTVRQKDFYKILGVIDSAELVVIKAAYKALMMLYHPDRSSGNKEAEAVRKSKELNEAYAVLVDPEKRRKYDVDKLRHAVKLGDKSEEELQAKLMFNKLSEEIRLLLTESEELLKILSFTD